MANIAQPQIEIHYISELKKIFCGRNQQQITQLFKVDSQINDFYYFQIINKNNQIVDLHNRSFEIYLSYIDAKQKQHILAHNSSYAIEDNKLIFQINTYTDKYLEYVTVQKEINITIVETTLPITQVVLRDKALAYPRPYIDGKTIQQIVEYETLTGLNVPVSGSFASGQDISLIPGVQSFALGEGLITMNQNQLVLGQFNVPDAEQAFIIANGTNINNRSNLFTVNYDGTAYLSGVRILTNLDRTNVSELNNDIGYITIDDVPVYSAGAGIEVDNNVISLTAEIPSAVSQLVNDDGYLTAVPSTYALKTDIPLSTSQLVNDDGFISFMQFHIWDENTGRWNWETVTQVALSHDFQKYETEYKLNYEVISGNLNLSAYALKTDIPTNNNQLTNGAGYITNSALDGYATTAWITQQGYLTAVPSTYALKTDIPTDYVTSSALTGYATTGWVEEQGYLTAIPVGIYVDDDRQYFDMTQIDLSNQFYQSEQQIYLNTNAVWSEIQENGYLDDYAQISAIPSAVSQLTNDTGYLSSIVINIDGTDETQMTSLCLDNNFYVYQDMVGIDVNSVYQSMYDSQLFNDFALTSDIPTAVSELTNDTGYITSSALTGISGDKYQTLVTDNTVQTSAYVIQYQPSADIVYNTIQTNNGVLNLNLVSGYESIPTGRVVTFEEWIKPSGELTGVTFASDLNFIGELPSSFTSGDIQVFTRRIIRIDDKKTIQQIAYAYEFEEKIILQPIPSSDPLTFRGLNSTNAVRLHGLKNNVSLQYSKNDGAWTNYTIGDTIQLNKYETVAFSGANNQFSDAYDSLQFAMTGQIEAGGNVMSLMNYSLSCTDYCFDGLFRDCTSLVKAPCLPATSVAERCYNEMFYNTGIIVAPELPATTLADSCYNNMFHDCFSLTASPDLPATTLVDSCYYCMFESCTSLKDAPYIPNVTFGTQSLFQMFYSCSSLSGISVGFTEWGDSNATESWVQNVAENGIFTKPTALSEYNGSDYIPSNWTVVNV